MQSPYCFLTPSQLKNGGNIDASTFTFFLWKMARKTRIVFIIVIRFVPRGSLCRKTNKMTCAHSAHSTHSEDLDQPRHSENGGKIKTNIYLVHGKMAGKSKITFFRFMGSLELLRSYWGGGEEAWGIIEEGAEEAKRSSIRIYTSKNKSKSPHAIHIFKCLYRLFFYFKCCAILYNFKWMKFDTK